MNALSRGTIPQDTGQPEDLKIVPEEPDTIRSIFSLYTAGTERADPNENV